MREFEWDGVGVHDAVCECGVGRDDGDVATDTATAAINIAHNPGAGVAALYGMGSANSTFSPVLTSAPSSFEVILVFTGGGLFESSAITIDGSGNAWVTSLVKNSVTELSSSGSVLSGTAGYTGGGLNTPTSVAIDPSGDAWVANYGGNSVTKLSSSGSPLSGSNGFNGGGMVAPFSIAIDGSGNAWVVGAPGALIELSNSGAILSGTSGFAVPFVPGSDYNPYTIFNPNALAIDGNGNVWIASGGTSSVLYVSSSGSNLSGASGFTGFTYPLGSQLMAWAMRGLQTSCITQQHFPTRALSLPDHLRPGLIPLSPSMAPAEPGSEATV